MEIFILSKTLPKQSYQDGITSFYKEYAIGHKLLPEEYNAYYKTFESIFSFANPSFVMRRRVDVLNDETIVPREWEIVDCYDGEIKAANSFGETDYYNAQSLHPLHVEAVKNQRRFEELHREHKSLLDEQNNLKEFYNRKYETELRERRLWSAAQENRAPRHVIDEIQNRLRAERAADEQRIDKRRAEIVEEMKETF